MCEELAVHGKALGVTVAYHPHTACTVETAAEIDRLLARTTVLTLCLDASHIALVDEDPVAHLRTYRERTSYVHLKDWARGAFIELGRGTIGIDTPAFLKNSKPNPSPAGSSSSRAAAKFPRPKAPASTLSTCADWGMSCEPLREDLTPYPLSIAMERGLRRRCFQTHRRFPLPLVATGRRGPGG